MRNPISRFTATGLAVAAMALGAWSAPGATAQSSTHKKSTKSRLGSAATHSSVARTTPPGARNATKSTASKSVKTSGRKYSKTKKVKGQAAPAPERITEIQDALAKRGVFAGASTGKLDDSTSDALKKFQATNHLNPSGKIDAPTLQKLGLGSETAGLAAPTPPPNSVANRLLSRTARPDPNDNNQP